MPELPEVETVCRGLASVLVGRRFAKVELRRKDLRIPFPKGLAAAVTGAKVLRIYRRAKYVMMELDTAQTLIAHLGMSGRMVIAKDKSPPETHDHVIFTTDDGTTVRFSDPRRFGLLTLAPSADLEGHKLFKHLGPDAMSETLTGDYLSKALKGRKTAIKVAIMDQRLVVGVGNIYASEALHRAGISPKRKAGSVAGARAQALVPAIKEVLAEAIAAGGSSLRDHVQPSGELGYFQNAWRVYGREGETCRCSNSAAVKRIVQGGRSTFFCVRCQS